MNQNTNQTPGPWYPAAADGMDFTAIATVPKLEGAMDLDHEVLGASEWLRVKPKDLKLMATAPELFYALRDLVDVMTGRKEGEAAALHNALAALRKAADTA